MRSSGIDTGEEASEKPVDRLEQLVHPDDEVAAWEKGNQGIADGSLVIRCTLKYKSAHVCPDILRFRIRNAESDIPHSPLVLFTKFRSSCQATR